MNPRKRLAVWIAIAVFGAGAWIGVAGLMAKADAADVRDNIVEHWPAFLSAVSVVPGADENLMDSVGDQCLSPLGGPGSPGLSIFGGWKVEMPYREAVKSSSDVHESWRQTGFDVQDGWIWFEGPARLRIRVNAGTEYLSVFVAADCAEGHQNEVLPGL